MNIRIRELLEQVAPQGHDNVAGMTLIGPNIEKFAELVVADCADQIQELLDYHEQVDEFDQGVFTGLDMAQTRIKEHFGVK